MAVAMGPDGRSEIVAIACAGASVWYISVHRMSSSTSDQPELVWTIDVSADLATDQSVFPMFVVPAGWDVRRNTLTSIDDGERYGVFVAVGKGTNAEINFSGADLRSLSADQVLAPDRKLRSLDGHAVARSEFEKSANRSCE